MIPTLENPTGRNTKAHIVTDTTGNEFFFSYETCIAFRGSVAIPLEDGRQGAAEYVTIRRPNNWGPTTGRHFRELGCKEFEELSTEDFVARLEFVC